jgi:hypothetical protein
VQIEDPKFRDLTGQRFGKVCVISYAGKGRNPEGARWLARCDCGAEFKAPSNKIKLGCFKCNDAASQT